MIFRKASGWAWLPLAAALVVACGGPPPGGPPPGQDGGSGDGGSSDGGGDGGQDGGGGGGPDGGSPDAGELDAGGPITAAPGQWTWIPVDGAKCASGSTAGFAVNLSDAGQDLFIFLQGGGACWNTGTCVPSLVQYGPICSYGTWCLYDGPGGTQPTAVYVTAPDPFPRDGGGALPGELAQIQANRVVDRSDPTNPFRNATFVFVPYCTGDLHSGRSTRSYPYKYGAFDPVRQYTVHFAGARNMELYLRKLHLTLPDVQRVWLTGSSAGGYGATLSFERARQEFAGAEIALLADSSPLLPTYHWNDWHNAWSPELPAGCTDCDAGLPRLMDHLLATYPDSRMGLLAFEQDHVISWYFYGAPGLDDILSPPVGPYAADLATLEASYDATANGRYFVLSGTQHVLWPGYGTRLADGGYSAPRPSNDGGTDLKSWIDAWATGAPGWTSTR